MCNPLTIGSAALSLGGTFMQMQAQRRAQQGINNAIRNNDNANDSLRQKSQAAISTSADKFSRDKFDQNQTVETGKVQKSLMDALTPGALPGEYYGGKQSENTRAYAEQKDAKANDFSKQMAEALANLRGFGQGQSVNTRGIQRAGEVVGMNQNKEAGNNAILPIEIDAAKRKGQSPLGDLFTGLGGAGLSAGLSAGGGGGVFNSQGGFSRLIGTGNSNFVGPMQGFGGWNLG